MSPARTRFESAGPLRFPGQEPSLFIRVKPDARSIAERFEAFHAAHPEVYRLFAQLAGQLLAAGHGRGSAEQIVQRIRWEFAVNEPRHAGFKINDHFRALYARKLAAEDPRFADFFEFRRRRRA